MLNIVNQRLVQPLAVFLHLFFIGGLLSLGAFSSTYQQLVKPVPSAYWLQLFFLSLLLMLVHKTESFYTREYDLDPIFHWLKKKPTFQHAPRAMFLTFVLFFMLLMFILQLVLLGGHWPVTMMMVWGAIFMHELHHLGKTLRTKMYYSGVFTGTLFSLLGIFFYFPELILHLDLSTKTQKLLQGGIWLWAAIELLATFGQDPTWITYLQKNEDKPQAL